ncbi:hypothetical protein Q9R32_11540 [Actinotalea sp. AC32]|nr:hypothetical protein [Actinotalea sp. AC32]
MLWFTVWALLVVGTLVGAFLLLRDLYRRARRLLAELERSSAALTEASQRAAEREEQLELTVPVPVDLSDPGPARARRLLALQARARRRAARAARHEAVYARWRAFSH